jgi:hypothetical protein
MGWMTAEIIRMKEIAHVVPRHLCVTMGDVYRHLGLVTMTTTVMIILMKEIAPSQV